MTWVLNTCTGKAWHEQYTKDHTLASLQHVASLIKTLHLVKYKLESKYWFYYVSLVAWCRAGTCECGKVSKYTVH